VGRLNGGFGTIKMGAGLTAYDDVFGMDHLLLSNGIENMNNLGGGVNPVISSGNNFALTEPGRWRSQHRQPA
jgi:hypothetical protein